MADSLEAQLIRGGIAPAAASVLANAIANRNTQQVQSATQLVDGTPTDELRLITPEARRSRYTNLDSVPSDRFRNSLSAKTRGLARPNRQHPYENAEPRSTTPRLHTPSITGGDLINVETKVEQDVQQTKISLDVLGSGRHLRISQSRREIDAVDFDTQNETEAKLTNEFLERQGRTTLRSKINGLSTQEAVLADGSVKQVSGWFDLATQIAPAFSSFAKSAFMNAADADEAIEGLSEVGTWSPQYFVTDGTNDYFLPPEAYIESTAGANFGKSLRSGIYFKLGPLVFFFGRIGTRNTDASSNTVFASASFHDTSLAYPASFASQKTLYVTPLPFSPSYTSASALHTAKFRAPVLETWNILSPYTSNKQHIPSYFQVDPSGRLLLINRTEDSFGALSGTATYSIGTTSHIINNADRSVRTTSITFQGWFLTTDLNQFV